MQKKQHSFFEAISNVVVGYVASYFATVLVLPHLGFPVTTEQVLQITFIFTFISLVRSYVIRRLFDRFSK